MVTVSQEGETLVLPRDNQNWAGKANELRAQDIGGAPNTEEQCQFP